MTLEYRSWLPANAAAPRLAQGAVADMVEAWSRHWFARETLCAGSFARISEPRGELRRTAWHVCSGGLAIGLPTAGSAALGAEMLGLGLSANERPRADLELLERLGCECLDDLKARATVLFELTNASWSTAEGTGRDGGAVHRLDIADPARRIALTLELTASLFARFVRAKQPPPPPAPALGAPHAALAPQPLHVSAALGECRLTLAELSGLAAGDVLVLDRALDAALPLALEGWTLPRGTCRIAEHDGALTLEIAQPPME